MSNIIDIDGSVLEGGGQIIRMSVALSALCALPIRIFNIRAGRSKPGLAAQHLKGILLVRDMCGARVRGAEIGSTEIEFIPSNTIKGGEYYADTQTAGSVSLLLQVALPCAFFANGPVTLQLKGGTNAAMAPQVDFTTEVFRPNLEKFGVTFDFDLHKRGYFPKGGGHVTAFIQPVRSLKSVNITELGYVKSVTGWSYVAGTLPQKLSEEMAEGAKMEWRAFTNSVQPKIECYKELHNMAPNNGSGMTLVCETSAGCIIGGDGLGAGNIRPNDTGASVVKKIIAPLDAGACVDNYTQDQLIIFMALADGESSINVAEVTLHTKTAIYISEKLTKAKFTIQECDSKSSVIKCSGINLTNKFVNI